MRFPNLPQALGMGLIVAEDNSRDNSVLHVTDLAVTMEGEGCPRQLWLKLRGADKRKLTAGQLFMFYHGKRIHEDLTEIFKKGLPREWEIVGVEVPMEFDEIHGTADCLIINRDTGERIVVDYKTIRGKGFSYLPNVKPAHGLQVQTYTYGLHQIQRFMPDAGLVFYADREGQNASIQFPVMPDDGAVIHAIKETKLIRDSKDIPPILEPIIKRGKDTKTKGTPITLAMPWNCDYCQYRDVTCHGALPYDYRQMGVIGHLVDGEYKPAKELPAEVDKIVVDILRRETDGKPATV